jgi:hypothetical protein
MRRFAVENYDAIGRWRSEDAGTPINNQKRTFSLKRLS